jgi:8-amino-7-oxononanoate synthase
LVTAAPKQIHQATSAIIPWLIGDEAAALAAAANLRTQQIYIPAIRYPTVARGAARLRISLSAAHSAADVAALAAALKAINNFDPQTTAAASGHK